jgi:hypothetical protein
MGTHERERELCGAYELPRHLGGGTLRKLSPGVLRLVAVSCKSGHCLEIGIEHDDAFVSRGIGDQGVQRSLRERTCRSRAGRCNGRRRRRSPRRASSPPPPAACVAATPACAAFARSAAVAKPEVPFGDAEADRLLKGEEALRRAVDPAQDAREDRMFARSALLIRLGLCRPRTLALDPPRRRLRSALIFASLAFVRLCHHSPAKTPRITAVARSSSQSVGPRAWFRSRPRDPPGRYLRINVPGSRADKPLAARSRVVPLEVVPQEPRPWRPGVAHRGALRRCGPHGRNECEVPGPASTCSSASRSEAEPSST